MRQWFGALFALALTLLLASDARAQSDPPPQASPSGRAEGAARDHVKARPVREVTDTEINRRMRDYVQSGEGKITIYQVVQEMIDDLIADSRELNIAAVSPLAVRGVTLTPNLSSAFGLWVESELINAVSQHTDISLKRCISCNALRTKLDGDDWIVSLGHTRQQDLADEARRLGVVAYLDAYLAYVPGANIVSLNVQLYRAEDGKILWTETYQSDASTAAILRSGDRVLTRDEAKRELVRKIEQRPYYGYQILGGAGYIPYDSPAGGLTGAMIGGRLYEQFGEDRRWLYGFHGESFINLSENALLGAFIGATMQYQLNAPNLNDPTYRVGGVVQGFIAGTEGNSFALEGVFEVIMQFRYGASVGVMYFNPTTFANADLGGLGFKGRIILNW